MFLTTHIRRAAVMGLLTAGLLATSALAQDAGWPRTFTNADGTTTVIPSQPKNILSTSVTITGTLLAIDAPIKFSASAANGAYFGQWAGVAEERGVENIWPAEGVDLEAAYAAAPDLIIVATSGADSAIDQLAEFQAIAPTIVLNYGGQTWQDLAAEIGDAAGIEEQVASKVDAFNTYIEESKAKIAVPAGTANIIAYNGPGSEAPIARLGGVHAGILTELGFTVEDPKQEWHTLPGMREDFIWAPYEKLVELTSDTTFLLRVDNSGTADFLADPVLANLPAVKAKQVYGFGANSFRIDYYSATEVVDGIVANFAK